MIKLIMLSLVIAILTVVWAAADDSGYNRAMSNLAGVEKEWRDKLKVKQAKIDIIQLKLIDEKNNIKIVTKTIIEKVKYYVKDDVSCNFSRGAVRLFNQGWDSGSVSDNSSLLESETSQTSTITQSAIIRKGIEYGGWCQELETNFDALVSSLNELNSESVRRTSLKQVR